MLSIGSQLRKLWILAISVISMLPLHINWENCCVIRRKPFKPVTLQPPDYAPQDTFHSRYVTSRLQWWTTRLPSIHFVTRHFVTLKDFLKRSKYSCIAQLHNYRIEIAIVSSQIQDSLVLRNIHSDDKLQNCLISIRICVPRIKGQLQTHHSTVELYAQQRSKIELETN